MNMKTKCEEINSKLLAACKRAFDFVDDEFNNKTVVEMNGSFGLWYRDWETDRKSTRLNSSHRL